MVLASYVAHYNEHRPHRALGQASPLTAVPLTTPTADMRSCGSIDWAGSSTNMLRSHAADGIFGTHGVELHGQFDLGAFALAMRRARTSGLLGSSKWLTPGLSVRLKCQQRIALQALTASLVMSSWLMSPSRVKNSVVPVTN